MSSPHASLPDLRVGVSGHRKLGEDAMASWYVHAHCVRILDRLQELANSYSAGLTAYSALAIGADQLFAQAALGLGISLEGVIPFEDYPDDFEGADRIMFDNLLAKCRNVHRLPRKRHSKQAYLEGGRWVVDRVDFLIAVWNGLPAAGKGGTGDIVAYAQQKNRTVFRITPQGAS